MLQSQDHAGPVAPSLVATGLLRPLRRSTMARLIIAVVVGLVLATAGSVLAVRALTPVSDGHPTQASLFQYGIR